MSAPERVRLDATSWVDVWRGHLPDPQALFDDLLARAPFQRGRLYTYDHDRAMNYSRAAVPHTFAPVLVDTFKLLRRTYGREFQTPTLVHYAHGREAMGSHRDSDMRWCEDTLVAILSLGAQRPFTFRPGRSSREAPPVLDLAPASGDLLVMGGRAQADWLHAVPPAPGVHAPRISVQWRWTLRTGRPEVGHGSQTSRRYGHGR